VLRATAARLGFLLSHCRHEIEDAVQAAFADTFRRLQEKSIADILTDGAFRRYIATAAANQVRQMRRQADADKRGGGKVQRRGDLVRGDDESVFDVLGAPGAGPSTVADRNEREQQLEKAVLDLPEPYRTAIQLHCYCGLSYEEIAASGELLSSRSKQPIRTREAVKLVVHRARQRLGLPD
jgi:RNA polymerase sigma factor (sigma-70 family)